MYFRVSKELVRQYRTCLTLKSSERKKSFLIAFKQFPKQFDQFTKRQRNVRKTKCSYNFMEEKN